MKHRNRKSRRARPEQGQSQDRRSAPSPAPPGFTLLEIMVVIFVMGILTAAVVVNWSTFMRHQELRSDAINLHKEILAMKARAVENDDSARMGIAIGGNTCTLLWRVNEPTNTNPDVGVWKKKIIPLNKDVRIDTVAAISGDLARLSGNPAYNNWRASETYVKILINPDTLRASSVNAFANGRIVLKSALAKVTARYCIQKDSTCMKPEIYHQTKDVAAWKRL